MKTIISGESFVPGGVGSSTWLIKLTADGDIQWQKTLTNYQLSTLEQTRDGGYVASGSSPNSTGNWSPAVLKLDGHANIQWQKIFNSLSAFINTIRQTIDGGYILAANIYNGTGGTDFIVIKLDSQGRISECPEGLLSNNEIKVKIIKGSLENGPDLVINDTSISPVDSYISPVEASIDEISICRAAEPKLSISSTAIEFGSLLINTPSAPHALAIYNDGVANLTLTSVTLTGQNPLEFSQTNSCTTLTPTSFCMVSLQFTPLSAGQKKASLDVLSNDPTQPMISVALSGTGVLPKYNLSATLKGNGGGFVKSSGSFC